LPELLLTLKLKPCSIATLIAVSSTFRLEPEMQHMRSVARYRRSVNEIVVYVILANNNTERETNPSVLLALLVAMIYTKFAHSGRFMHIFSLLTIVM
jgi:hypothetical protein